MEERSIDHNHPEVEATTRKGLYIAANMVGAHIVADIEDIAAAPENIAANKMVAHIAAVADIAADNKYEAEEYIEQVAAWCIQRLPHNCLPNKKLSDKDSAR